MTWTANSHIGYMYFLTRVFQTLLLLCKNHHQNKCLLHQNSASNQALGSMERLTIVWLVVKLMSITYNGVKFQSMRSGKIGAWVLLLNPWHGGKEIISLFLQFNLVLCILCPNIAITKLHVIHFIYDVYK